MNVYDYTTCGQTALIEHEAIEAGLAPPSNRCRRAGGKEAWPSDGVTAASHNVDQLENLLPFAAQE
ncbi:TPA: hypothetical protein ACNIJL_000014 [Pseudomonas aeruginosa]